MVLTAEDWLGCSNTMRYVHEAAGTTYKMLAMHPRMEGVAVVLSLLLSKEDSKASKISRTKMIKIKELSRIPMMFRTLMTLCN